MLYPSLWFIFGAWNLAGIGLVSSAPAFIATAYGVAAFLLPKPATFLSTYTGLDTLLGSVNKFELQVDILIN